MRDIVFCRSRIVKRNLSGSSGVSSASLSLSHRRASLNSERKLHVMPEADGLEQRPTFL